MVKQMRRPLTVSEYKKAANWEVSSFVVESGNDVLYLYNEDRRLLAAGSYMNTYNDFDITPFANTTLKLLTKRDLAEKYKKKREIKKHLWQIYGVNIVEGKPVRVKKNCTIELARGPNKLGFYYASIKNAKIFFINDNVDELLIDLFFTLECYIGREDIPKTFSSYWFDDFRSYSNRRNPETSSRLFVESSYFNYGFDLLMKFFNEEKISHKIAYDLFKRINDNKYYIMEVILKDDHFSIDENNFIVYYPITEGVFKKSFVSLNEGL